MAVPTASLAERRFEAPGGEKVGAELGDLSTPLATLQEKVREVADLVDADEAGAAAARRAGTQAR